VNKQIYFDVYNGKATTLSENYPSYCAVVGGLIPRVLEIKVCFAKANIERYGELWALNQVLKSREQWTGYKWLMPSLNKFVFNNWFRSFRDFEKEQEQHYTFVPIGLIK
jgi:hypothetical protein